MKLKDSARFRSSGAQTSERSQQIQRRAGATWREADQGSSSRKAAVKPGIVAAKGNPQQIEGKQ
jgi:hypothetical protein